MSGLKLKRLIWTVIFLGITLTAIVMEVVAGIFHPTGWTIPWTEYLARYVPWPVQLLAYVALVVWLPFHFWRHDHMRKVAYNRGVAASNRPMLTARALQQATTDQLLDELNTRGVRRFSTAASQSVLMPGEDVSLGPWPDPAPDEARLAQLAALDDRDFIERERARRQDLG